VGHPLFDDDSFCSTGSGKWNRDQVVAGLVWAAGYHVVSRGPASQRTIHVGPSTGVEREVGVGTEPGPTWDIVGGQQVRLIKCAHRAVSGEAQLRSPMYDFDPKRLEKLAALRASGINPYPHGLRSSASVAEALLKMGERGAEELEADPTRVELAGRVMFKNEMGKAGFLRIQDPTGRIQLYIRKNDVGDDAFEVFKKLDLGDHVTVTGGLMRTRAGEPSIKAATLGLAAKCIASMPDKWQGVTDAEFRNRHRYVDLFMNEEGRAAFVSRSRIVRSIRRYFEERGYLEVETPMMQAIPGGAAARPFVTHHNALDIDLYLRIAPELYLKRLVVGGLERVFEINRNFRNEGVSTSHNPEFTMLEFYQAWATWEDLMVMTEEMVRGLAQELHGRTQVTWGEHQIELAGPWRRLPFAQAIAEATGLSPEQVQDPAALRARWLHDHPKDEKNPKLPQSRGKWFEWFFDEYVEQNLIQPTFLTHFPVEISPLSRRNDADPSLADRFELFIGGREIANGFNELNDPVDQAERFAAQASARRGGDDEAMFFDADYIHALTYGLPPTAGEGLGIDRLVMLLTNQSSIRDVILFPTLRPQ
jgi:lysyl-tRNA synthetase class 2